MKNRFFSLFICIIFFSCNTLIQDRDISPTLALRFHNKTETEYEFSFEMYSIENISAFACEIFFDENIFEIFSEKFTDLDDDGGWDYGEAFIDCGTDQCCDGFEMGNDECSLIESLIEDLNIDNYDSLNNPYGQEGNNKFDDQTIVFEDLFNSNTEPMDDFNYITYAEGGKISLVGAFVEETPGQQYVFEILDQKIATLKLRIKPGAVLDSSVISIGNWQLLQPDGTGAYFGGMVATETLYVTQ